MNDIRVLVPLVGTHPHFLKSTKARKNWAPDPRGIFAFGRRVDFNFSVARRKHPQLRQQPVTKTLGQSRPAWQHNIFVQIAPQIKIRTANWIGNDLMHTIELGANDVRWEQDLCWTGSALRPAAVLARRAV